MFVNVVIKCFDMPLKDGNVKGLWGRSDDKEGIIWRLGIVWGDLNPVGYSVSIVKCRVNERLHSLQVSEAAVQGEIVVTDLITAAHTDSAKLLDALQAKYETANKSAETANSDLALCRKNVDALQVKYEAAIKSAETANLD